MSKKDFWAATFSLFLFFAMGMANRSAADAINASGSWQTFTVDSAELVGQWTSIALDGSGKAHISYSDDANGDLKYATNAELVPFPDIRANGSDGPVTIAPGDPLTVTVALDPRSHEGEPADWWVAAASPFGFYWYTLDAGWVRSDAPIRVYGGPLFSLLIYPVLEISTLPAGAYTFYFGCDMAMNGLLDMDRLYYDRVEVNITP